MKKFMALLLSAAMLLSGCGILKSNKGSETAATSGISTKYASKLFDTSYVHKINIKINASDWSDLLKNPTKKTKYKADVTIDGETVDKVSFSTKGNTSLSSIASSDSSDKYSFKINFGKYIDDQTYYGLNKLNLNNIYADATYMKDYISYQISQKAGVDSPLTSFIQVTVNGKAQGLYLALEDVSESFLARTNGGNGELYKPETQQLNNVGNTNSKKNETKQSGMTPPDQNSSSNNQMSPPSGGFKDGDSVKSGNNGNGKMGFGSEDKGASLKYTDDKIDSYSDIFNNAETDSSKKNEKTVIASLKGLSEYLGDTSSTDLDKYVDTSSVIKYFAAHNFVMNYDSYTGSMLHNYYLYEKNGKLSMVPWDYNLAFGAFQGGGGMGSGRPGDNKTQIGTTNNTAKQDQSGTTNNTAKQDQSGITNNTAKQDQSGITNNRAKQTQSGNSQGLNATQIVNYGIDTPLSGAEGSDRPMWSWVTSKDKYLQEYHETYNKLLKTYFESGDFEKEVDRVAKMIRPYVEKDTYAEYTVSQFDTAVKTLKSFCTKRAESIRKQLDGTISTDTSKQNESTRVDASDINIQSMGSQGRDKKEQK